MLPYRSSMACIKATAHAKKRSLTMVFDLKAPMTIDRLILENFQNSFINVYAQAQHLLNLSIKSQPRLLSRLFGQPDLWTQKSLFAPSSAAIKKIKHFLK